MEISLWWVFFVQFTGLMPYVLEICCILALACQDWIDFAIIASIVICNAYLGFMEELKAKKSLDELTNKMEQKIAVLRDGKAEHLLTRLLVPGDVVLLLGGVQVPAGRFPISTRAGHIPIPMLSYTICTFLYVIHVIPNITHTLPLQRSYIALTSFIH